MTPRRLPALTGLLALALLASMGLRALSGPAEAGSPGAPAGLETIGVSVDAAGGARLSAAPAFRPDQPIPPGTDALALVGERLQRGNLQGAAQLLHDWLEGRLPDTRTPHARVRWYGARFLLGLVHMRQEQHNLASSQFTKVRASKTALASEAAWYEALADHRRGRHAVAARECARYRETWPAAAHEADCMLLEGEAWTAAGYHQPAHDAYQEFIDLDPDGHDVELARLGQALALANRSPRRAVPELQALALDYSYPTTRTAALAKLAELAEAGQRVELVDDDASRQRRAMSALRAHEFALARQLQAQLQGSEDPAVRAWVEEQRETFGWRTRSYRDLADLFIERYAASPDPETCWMAHRALFRGGFFLEAAQWGERGMSEHASHYRWRRASDDLARSWMMAGEEAKAIAIWDRLGRSSGGKGRQARWYAAFCAWRAGDLDEAARRLEQVRSGDAARSTRALYYLARVAEARESADEAAELYRAVLERDGLGWYGLLAASRLVPPAEGPAWLVRHGSWPFAPPAQPPQLVPVQVRPPSQQVAPPTRGALLEPAASPIAWSSLAWGAVVQPEQEELWDAAGSTPAEPQASAPQASAPPALSQLPPRSIVEGELYDPRQARSAFARFVPRPRGRWRVGPAAWGAPDVGAYELSGEMMARMHEEHEQARRRNDARSIQLRGVSLRMDEWREIFAFAGAWHLVSRFSMGLDKYTEGEEQRRQALAMAYPAAFPELVWASGREHDIDPLLTLSVMRQESQYKSWALSGAGAVGLVQVMPTTGALVARDVHRQRYSPRELLDPATNIHFGSWYLRQLLSRYGGALPLAVAGYNAGPQNVSSWLSGLGDDTPIDDFVELIPLDETRNYVRRVLGFYALHTRLYAPEGARVGLALSTAGDDPDGIDY